MRAECFLNPDGTYDWNKQQGQRNFLKLAKERGVSKFLAFLNSPPVYYTERIGYQHRPWRYSEPETGLL